MNGKRNFRALIQNVGVHKVKNSPKRRIQNVAKDAFLSSAKGRAVAALTLDATDASIRRGRHDSAETSILSLGWRPPFMAVGTPSNISSGFSLFARLQERHVQLHTSTNIKKKVRQAFLSAVATYEQLLAAVTRALEPSPEFLALSASTASPPIQPSPQVSGSADSGGTAAFYLDKMQHTFEEAKRYYNSTPFDERWDDILSSLAVLGRISHGNVVVPFHDSASAFECMWAAVKKAKERVHWQTYICKDDFIGQGTVRCLVQARQRGCDTELLYDCGGNISGRARLTEELKQCGAKVIPYRPFFRSVATYFIKGLDWKRSPGLRNHRKILLVDATQGFCGGLNIGNEYCGKTAGGTGKFRDTHCGVIGPAAAHLAEVYRDTKQPHPWKYGWRRWRQIASQQITRRVKQGRMRMERNEFYRAFQEERGRSGRRLKDVPSASMKVMRGRWNKQKSQLLTLMQWSRSGLSADVLLDREVVPPLQRQEGVRTDGTAVHVTDGAAPDCAASAESDLKATGNVPGSLVAKDTNEHLTTSASLGPSVLSTPAAGMHAGTLSGSPAALSSSGSKVNNTRNSAMRRKLLAARREALARATDLPHKRAYTDMLRRVPILDTEPVPEAQMYLRHRESMTQVLSCNPRYRDYSIQYAFWQVTRKCHRRIWITTPYYLPTRKLFSALAQAARRGVDVRLLAGSNQTTDPWFMWHASNYITERLLRAGVKIYEFQGQQIMHAKTVVVDSVWSSIGSYNWDLMSNRNLEVCLCHLDLEVAHSMETQFLRDLAQSVEIRLEDHKQRSLWLRFTSWLFYNVVFVLDRITFRSFASEDI
ncbi:cardiolipin synthetase, putative [Leishmania tarentolae]|uniref:Cardiolipin synthetase, putative n=1 Tax=Leishmania tarentolae TaxID=5689 RepID=A0A640KSA0_LEITA|nr:cardiolipin synthetase, putative [Leishmania tarentolae]